MTEKIFKNPARNNITPFQKYVPRYQIMGITPAPAATGEIAMHKGFAETGMLNRNIPFAARVLPKAADPKLANNKDILYRNNNVPYAEVAEMTPDIIRGAPLPNIGNNIENTWASMDSIILNDEVEYIQDNLDHSFIDNNFDDEVNYINIPQKIQESPKPQIDQMIHSEETMTVFDAEQLNIAYDEYILSIKGEIISTGSLEQIREEVKALVFNEHRLSEENIILIDDIIVLKRIKVKVGVFIE